MLVQAIFLCLGLLFFTPAANAADSGLQPGPDLSSVRAKIKAKDFQAALVELKPLAAKYDDADTFNLYAYSLRKTGNRDQAFVYYQKALQLNPNHKGALEYQGELFVETKQMANARQNLARLKALCPAGCEELSDLQEAIDAGPK